MNTMLMWNRRNIQSIKSINPRYRLGTPNTGPKLNLAYPVNAHDRYM